MKLAQKFALVAGICLLVMPGASKTSFAQDSVPDTHAGKRLSQMLEAIEGGGDKLETFLSDGFEERDDASVSKRRQRSEQIQSMLGTLSFAKTVASDSHSITARCKSSNGPVVLLSITVADSAPHRISQIRMEMAGDEEGETDETPLTQEEKAKTIQRIAEELRSKYVFPDVARKMCVDIENSLASGAYDEISDKHQFATHLTDQLREICKDKHLRVRAGGIRRPGAAPGRRPADNHGFVKAEMLPGGVGYLKFNYFSGDKAAEKTAAAAMAFLSHSQALIFDVRDNGGGSPDMIAFLSGYLFDESVHLNSFYNRPTETTTESWSRDDVADLGLGSVPVYVLTSNYTFSGAEEFSYNLKNLKRGVIVGETTGGGAHPVMPVQLGKRFSMSMPFARAINPITKTNWEGTGVEPDVPVAADKALDTAIQLATDRIQEAVENRQSKAASSDNADELMTTGTELMNSQEFARAAQVFRKVVEIQPDNGMAWFRLGYCLHIDGQLDEAIEVHRKAAEFDGTGPVAAYNLACAYSLKDNNDAAIEALQKALEMGFDDLTQIRSDSDLDNLRNDERFRKILEEDE